MSASPSNREHVKGDSMGVSPDLAHRRRHAKELAYLGCAGALGYGMMKVVWALDGTVGIRNPKHYRAGLAGLHSAGERFFDDWGTPILAGLAMVILLGLIYPWGNRPILRPLLRTLGWAGSLMAVGGVYGLVLFIRYYAGDHSIDRGDFYAGTYVFTYVCFTMLGVGFAGTVWLTRRRPRRSPPRSRSAAFRERSTPIPH